MLEVIKFKTEDREKFLEARKVREIVFIQEQKVEERDEFDEFENESNHFLLRLNGKTIGTARWRHSDEKIKLERFAVLKEERGKKYGDVLLDSVIKDAISTRKPMYLHAQLKAIPFYERRGFKKEGKLFVECDIEHYKMVRN